MKLNLVANWHRAYRLWSVRLIGAGTAVQTLFIAWADLPLTIWNMMPAEIHAHLPARVVFAIPALLYAAGGLARVFKQRKANVG